MATELERLSVLIEANTKSYERAMIRLQKQTDRAIRGASQSVSGLNAQLAAASKVANSFAKAFGVGIVAGGLSQIPGLLRDIVKQAADLQDTADRVGITTERLQELNFQAEQTGSSVATMADALSQFGKRISEAAQKGGPLAQLFEANGIALKDANGELRPFNDLLAEYIELIGNARNEQDALNVATLGFGRGAGKEMALTFQDGADGAARFANEARNLGAVIKDELLKVAAELDDKLDGIASAFRALVASSVIPFLRDTASEIQKINESIEFWRNIRRGGAAPPVEAISPEEYAANRALNEMGEALKGFKQDPDLLKALQKRLSIAPGSDEEEFTILPEPEKIQKSTQAIREGTAALSELVSTRIEDTAATEAQRQAQEHLIDSLDTVRNAAGSALDSFAQSIQHGEGALAGLKSALLDVLDTIIRIAEQQMIESLFGAFGTTGGGLFGKLLGGLAAPSLSAAGAGAAVGVSNVTISVVPGQMFVPVVTSIAGKVSVKAASAAEDRAIARAPAVARHGQRRFGSP